LIQAAPIAPAWLADPTWQSAEKLLGVRMTGHLSVNPAATLSGLMNLLVYASVFWLTFQLTRTPERAWTTIRVITWIGSAYALYGIIVYMSGNNWIVIYPKWTYVDSLTSTFVNRNSYATFAGLTLLCAVTSWLDHLKPFFALKHPLRSKIVLIVEETVAKAGFKTFAMITIAMALLLSASRGGVASSSIGLLVVVLLYLGQKGLGLKQMSLIMASSAIAAAIIFSASGNHLSKRLPNEQIDSSFDVRNEIYQTTWDAILIAPWKGTGFETFQDVFPAYRRSDMSPLILWDKAHNTYLENALELGLPAALLLNLAIVLVTIQCLRGAITRKRDKLLPALGVGATVLVGLHSLVDFSLQIPAVTILYACIMGLATSQSWSQGNLKSS
jgi:O-antigen ligase